jgi:hypothetical protein
MMQDSAKVCGRCHNTNRNFIRLSVNAILLFLVSCKFVVVNSSRENIDSRSSSIGIEKESTENIAVEAKILRGDSVHHTTTACIEINGNTDPNCIVPSSQNHEMFIQDTYLTDDDNNDKIRQSVPPGCKLVMAPSSLPNGGWGIFSLEDIQRGRPIIEGDVVIQLNDLNMTHADETFSVLQDYLWNSEETGGFYEGLHVVSVAPGVGMLANGLSTKEHYNVLPYVPTVDEGGLVRTESPGTGSISHYHNYTFFASKAIESGFEIFVNYSPVWFQTRQNRINAAVEGMKLLLAESPDEATSLRSESQQKAQQQQKSLSRDVDWLKRNGRCLDNLKVDKSEQPHAGRGVFAQRYIPMDGIVAPLPVVVIGRKELMEIRRSKKNGKIVQTKQLLLNYCLGHPESSILLFSYSPHVK